MKFKDSYHPYAIITIVFWSLAYVLTRLTLQYFSSFSLGFLRYFIASCALLCIAFITKMKFPSKKDFPWFLLAGAVGFFIYIITFNKGQESISASTASVVIATVPVITAVLARFIYSEKLSCIQWGAIIIELIGVCILTLLKGIFSINIGLLWLFLAALVLSIYNLIQRRLTKKYTALQTSSFSIACFYERGFTRTFYTIILCCIIRCIFQCDCIYCMVKSIFKSKTDLGCK